MTRRMLINAQRPQELRVAVTTDTTLDEYQVSVAEAGTIRGNLYRGVVTSIKPALSAAFVDFGAERDALIAADDVVPQAYHRSPGDKERHPKIDRILERGRPLLIQITKDPSSNKGAAATTNISLAGRYLVLMPYGGPRGISHRVEDEEERERIREVLTDVTIPEGFGFIVRTNALHQSKKELNRDVNALLRLWKRIRSEANQGKGPRLLYSDQDLIVRAVRDWLDNSVDEVLVDEEEAYHKVLGAMRAFMPRSRIKVTHYQDRLPLFSRFQLQQQIETIFEPNVDLPSGGSIVIEGTEALTAIDVNSGRSTRSSSEEETAFRTNKEAVAEVARQLRLRDIGGLIVVDLIDMRSLNHRKEIERAARDALKTDRARVSIGRISQNGLLEINRQRLKSPLVLRTHRLCPTCGGGGRIPSPETVSLNLMRRIEERGVQGDIGGVTVHLHPELADALQNRYRSELVELERELDIRIDVVAASGFHRSEQEIEWHPQREAAPEAPEAAVDLVELASDGSRRKKETTVEEAKSGKSDGGGQEPSRSSKRRRRRRPKRRKDTG